MSPFRYGITRRGTISSSNNKPLDNSLDQSPLYCLVSGAYEPVIRFCCNQEIDISPGVFWLYERVYILGIPISCQGFWRPVRIRASRLDQCKVTFNVMSSRWERRGGHQEVKLGIEPQSRYASRNQCLHCYLVSEPLIQL